MNFNDRNRGQQTSRQKATPTASKQLTFSNDGGRTARGVANGIALCAESSVTLRVAGREARARDIGHAGRGRSRDGAFLHPCGARGLGGHGNGLLCERASVHDAKSEGKEKMCRGKRCYSQGERTWMCGAHRRAVRFDKSPPNKELGWMDNG
eukprot:9475628-Pyramimonas_sp.AAC.2